MQRDGRVSLFDLRPPLLSLAIRPYDLYWRAVTWNEAGPQLEYQNLDALLRVEGITGDDREDIERLLAEMGAEHRAIVAAQREQAMKRGGI